MEALTQRPHLLCPIVLTEDVGAARRRVAAVAGDAGAGAATLAHVELAVTELGTNLVRHAEAGAAILARPLDTPAGTGVEVLSVDRGPGIADLTAALAGSVAEPAGLGCGLAGVRRLASEFDVYTRAGAGTVVMARFLPGDAGGDALRSTRWSGLSVAVDGESECGDAWAIADDGGRTTILVVDGLGHGPGAAAAAQVAVDIFTRRSGDDLEALARGIHDGMRSTRGGAAAICRLDPLLRRADFVGVGNVSGRLVAADSSRAMVSLNGTLGTELATPRIRRLSYELDSDAALVMSSDGVRDGFAIDAHPGLLEHDPLVVAAVIHGQNSRGTDDATVVVVRPTVGVAA